MHWYKVIISDCLICRAVFFKLQMDSWQSENFQMLYNSVMSWVGHRPIKELGRISSKIKSKHVKTLIAVTLSLLNLT